MVASLPVPKFASRIESARDHAGSRMTFPGFGSQDGVAFRRFLT